MRLITSIPPRRDGTVVAKSPDNSRTFTFKADASGELACDVDCEDTLAALLRSESFYPSDEADFSAAMRLAGGVPASGGVSQGGEGGDLDVDPDDDGDDDGEEDAHDETPEGGAPVESETPRVQVTAAAVSRKRAK